MHESYSCGCQNGDGAVRLVCWNVAEGNDNRHRTRHGIDTSSLGSRFNGQGQGRLATIECYQKRVGTASWEHCGRSSFMTTSLHTATNFVVLERGWEEKVLSLLSDWLWQDGSWNPSKSGVRPICARGAWEPPSMQVCICSFKVSKPPHHLRGKVHANCYDKQPLGMPAKATQSGLSKGSLLCSTTWPDS